MTKIAFIGAGSVVFTQGLLADLFGLDLGPLQIALQDFDPERLDSAAAAASFLSQDRAVQITANL
jgi:alpha-galactosidase